MSLTQQLRDKGSPVKAYLEGLSPRLTASVRRTSGGRFGEDALGLMELAEAPLLIPRPGGVDGTLAGTAFDYRARIELGDFDPLESFAAAGSLRADGYRSLVDNGEHRVNVLQGAFEVAVGLLRSGDDLDRDRASVLLAHCERVVRAPGSTALSGTTGSLLDAASSGADFAAQIDRSTLDDVGTLLGASRPQITSWQEEIADGIAYVPNPQFSGASLVGGADGDWLIGDTLIDSKVYSHVDVSTLRAHILQLLGYVMLDLDDLYGIRRVAVWLPRQQMLATWPLGRILSGDAEELLPTLREGFVKATGRKQVARQEPIPERRRHQMLADNRHTPYEHLEDLSHSEDADIRRRVGRNVVTPETTIQRLARDRAWKVREGVATNDAAPDDVLQLLATDRSKAVRLAVATNPGTPRTSVSALTTDTDPSVQWSARSNDGTRDTARGPLVAVEAAATGTEVGTTSDRDDSAWSSEVVEGVLDIILDDHTWRLMRNPIPEASRVWAHLSERDISVPEWPRPRPPREVVYSLMQPGRPDWIRYRAAVTLPIDDVEVRSRLLRDSDPDIRWSALLRTIDTTATDLTALLAELGESKSARVAFRRDGADEYLRKSASESEKEVLEVLARHRASPPSLLNELASAATVSIRLALVKNPALSEPERLRLIEALLAGRVADSRAELARVTPLPVEVIERLAVDRDNSVREIVAQRADLTKKALGGLALDEQWDVRFALLCNPAAAERLPRGFDTEVVRTAPDPMVPELLEVLDGLPTSDELVAAMTGALARIAKSRIRYPDLRGTAARNVLTPATTLAHLGRSTDADLREDVAGNISTPLPTLSRLAADDAVNVRAAIAGNVSSPAAVTTDLSHDDARQVRAAVAGRAELSMEILARLLEDPDSGVRRAAMRHPSAEEAARRHGLRTEEAPMEVSRHSAPASADRTTFETKAHSRRAEERIGVAYDARTPVDILEFLGGERRSSRVRRAVAANPHAPARLLRQLAHDDDEQVRQAVAFNGSTEPEVLLDMADKSIDLALLVALNPDTPDVVLVRLSQDAEPLLRYVTAGAQAKRLLERASPSAPRRHISDGHIE